MQRTAIAQQRTASACTHSIAQQCTTTYSNTATHSNAQKYTAPQKSTRQRMTAQSNAQQATCSNAQHGNEQQRTATHNNAQRRKATHSDAQLRPASHSNAATRDNIKQRTATRSNAAQRITTAKLPKKYVKCVIHLKNEKKVLIWRGRGAHRCHHARTKTILFLKS